MISSQCKFGEKRIGLKHLPRDEKEHAGSEGKTNVRMSTNTGAVYDINKCAVMEIERGKVIKGEELYVINEKMNALDPENNEVYKCECEESSGISKTNVMARITEETTKKRANGLMELELYDKNLLKAVNTRVIPAVAYPVNAMKVRFEDVKEMDMIIKRALQERRILGKQTINVLLSILSFHMYLP